MAVIDLNTEFARVTVKFEQGIPAGILANTDTLVIEYVNLNEVGSFALVKFQYIDLGAGKEIVPIAYPEKIMSLVMPLYGSAKIGFYINGSVAHLELIQFSNALIRASFDPLKLNTQNTHLPQKPGRVAVFTQTYNEGNMLLYWEQFYAKKVGYENLFVLNNASEDDSCSRLNPKTSVINMPKAPVDHDHFAQAHGYLQRFLLLKYDWVIKVDTDELLSCEGDLVETITKLAPGTYTPELGIEIIHDVDNEPPFDFSGTVGAQRKHFVLGTEFLIRPIISSVPTTWTSGNHMSHELNQALPGLFSVHLKYFDLDFLLSKNKKWAQMTQTEHETTTCRQISDLQALGLDGIYGLSRKEIADRLADERIPVPDWFAGSV